MSDSDRFSPGDRVVARGVGSGRFQRQTISAAIIVRSAPPRYTVRFDDLGRRRIATATVDASQLIAAADADWTPWTVRAWERLEAD